MTRVRVVVEGPTEESFVGDVLAPVLWTRNVYLTPILIGTAGHKGGNTKYVRVRKDVLLLLEQDTSACCTMMIDFYGLGKGFPGLNESSGLTSAVRVTPIEQAVKEDICSQIPDLRPDIRFLPYLHEYEALLFSDPRAFAEGMEQPHLEKVFQKVRGEFETPEDINNDPNHAPCKRILLAYPAYRKVIDGTLAARAVGIHRMRQECPHFRQWVERLEALAT